MGRLWRWLVRPGIGKRIALAMVISLVAVQAQVFLQLAVFASFEVRMTGTRWLAETSAEAVHTAFAALPDQRASTLRRFGRDLPVELTWGWSRPTWSGSRASPVTDRLAATLRALLGQDVREIEVTLSPLNYVPPVRALKVAIVPAGVGDRLGLAPLQAGEADILIPASVRVAVQGMDGSWVGVAPVSFEVSGSLFKTPIVPLLAGGLIIAILSALTAKRIMAPLNRLLLAANKVGTSREVVPVADARLGEFAPVGQAFEDMQRRLFQLLDDRTQMLAAISHDLRSALTRLRIAAEQCGGETEQQAVITEVEDMQSMVESTLAFASGEARMTPSRQTDLATLLISLVDEAMDGGRLCLYDGPDHAELMAHPVALKRAFSNLIDNAVKYGGTARVHLAKEDNRLVVHVEDDGPGIPAALAEDAFTPFRRLDPARSNNVPGVGLGLTIARDVILSHGGKIALGSTDHPGLVVEVIFPKLESTSDFRPREVIAHGVGCARQAIANLPSTSLRMAARAVWPAIRAVPVTDRYPAWI